ncbi:MAG: hypothetical protein FWF79_02270 [Defluviitaleaceae bacterium]|nr:hypothetical protein [Defluviitaleaceae bacterium]
MDKENIKPAELASRQNRKVMLDCITALGDYAALLVANGNGTSAPIKEMREVVSDMVQYWGLDADNDDMGEKAFLRNFDDKIHDARISPPEVDTFSVCSDALTGLAQHGEDLIGSQGNDAMHEILKTADLLDEVGEYFGYIQETEFANNSARWLRNSVAGMLKEYDLPGKAVEGIINANYTIKQAVLFDNNMGIAFAHNPAAASPYVTWQMFNNSVNKQEFEWGNYFSTEEKALVDYIARHKDYTENHKVKEIPLPIVEVPEQDEWRTYKAEICVPNEEFPHFEVFGADNDVDAVEQANALCDGIAGSYLLEVHELNEDYDSIREISLRHHDPDARRFMDVDIIDFLGQIADKTVVHYKNDFKIDVDVLWEAALAKNPEAKRLMWHCCSYGTHLLREDEVFTKDTGAFGYWVEYRPKEPDMVGYAVEITGYEGDTLKGNVYDVGDYYSHAQYVRENSLVLDSLSLTYSGNWGINAGKTITVPRYEYDSDRHRLMSESGNVVKIQYHPSESVKKMADLLESEKNKHMAMPVGNTREHLEILDRKLAELRGLPEPTQQEKQDSLRIYHADFYDPEDSERMEIIVAIDDADALRQAKEICIESTGVLLAELNEVDENGEMREVSFTPQAVDIMPDPTITTEERNAFGYSYEEMLPLNEAGATDLFNKRYEVFLLYSDDTEGAAHSISEIVKHDGIFGIERENWLNSEEYEGVKELLKRVANVKNGRIDPHIDNMLRIVTDGRKAGIGEHFIQPIIDSTVTNKSISPEKQAETAKTEKPANQKQPKTKAKKKNRGEDR